MGFTDTQISQLKAKLDPKYVKIREQAGRALSYVEGWHAIAEANRIFGFDAWSRETIYLKEVSREKLPPNKYGKENWKVGYEAKVRITLDGVVREGTGHGQGTMSDLFDCIESAAKEAETDAMKRALMTFGNPFGLALYDKEQKDVGVEPKAPDPAKVKQAEEWARKQLIELGDSPASAIFGWTSTPDNVAKLKFVKSVSPALYQEFYALGVEV